MIAGAMLWALPALAADEAIRVTGMPEAAGQLSESLCLSQRCVEGEAAVVVEVKAAGTGAELQVRSRAGAVLLRERVALREDRRLSSADLARLAAQVHQAVENPSRRESAEPARRTVEGKAKLAARHDPVEARGARKAAKAKLLKAKAKAVAASASKRRARG